MFNFNNEIEKVAFESDVKLGVVLLGGVKLLAESDVRGAYIVQDLILLDCILMHIIPMISFSC